MAQRSTRNRIRWQAKKAAEKISQAIVHLQYLDELAFGQSPFINQNLPNLVVLLSEVEKLMIDFREGL